MKKFISLLLVLFFSLGIAVAEKRVVNVRMTVRYMDATFAELNTPFFDLDYIMKSCDGKVLVKYDFEVVTSPSWWQKSRDIVAIIEFPIHRIFMDAVEVTALDGSLKDLCKDIKGIAPRRLPKANPYLGKVCGNLYATPHLGIPLSMEWEKGNCGSIEFTIDYGKIFKSCRKSNDGELKSLLKKMPIDVKFESWDKVDKENKMKKSIYKWKEPIYKWADLKKLIDKDLSVGAKLEWIAYCLEYLVGEKNEKINALRGRIGEMSEDEKKKFNEALDEWLHNEQERVFKFLYQPLILVCSLDDCAFLVGCIFEYPDLAKSYTFMTK